MKKKKGLGRKPEDTKENKILFQAALAKNLGLVWRASKATGISSMTHYHWRKTDPIYKEKVDALIEEKRDFVENTLIKLVEARDASCVMFAAKCLLRPRGYDQSTEIRNPDGETFNINIGSDILKKALAETYSKADEAAEK